MDNQENSFEKAEYALRQSWEVHRQAFGPILDPAFLENQQVRIPLIAALNHISRREIKRGLEILKSIQDQCLYDADKAAWTFFVGLCFEMAGAKDQMLRWYADAGKYNHRFYLPYLKLARAAHSTADFAGARGYYETAIACLHEMPDNDRDEVILASAYTNLASCLTMMHRCQEAETAWKNAQQLPLRPGAEATAAILYAAMGKREISGSYLEDLKTKFPLLVEQTQEITQQILTGAHPHFSRVDVDAEKILSFWAWFSDHEKELAKQDSNTLSAATDQLKIVFPFLDREPKLLVTKEAGHLQITFSDFYAVGLHFGYGALLSACPEDLKSRWQFAIVH